MIAVYCITRDRLELTRKSLKALRQWSGVPFDLYVADNGSGPEMIKYLEYEKERGRIYHLQINGENMGQNLAANDLLDAISLVPYDWVMRWDPDGIPRTRYFLKKLVKVAEAFRKRGGVGVFSPKITKLNAPPPVVAEAQLGEVRLEVVEILGGICRLHPAQMFTEWRFNRMAPLGFGEAAEMARLCEQIEVPLLRVPHIEVEHWHGQDGQVEAYPEEFTWERREVGRYLSYGLS